MKFNLLNTLKKCRGLRSRLKIDKQKKNLSKKYKVKGIPTLILLDAKSGEIITVNGRDGVISNDVDAFPWKTKSVSEILAGIQTLDTKDGPQPFAQIIKPTSNLLLYFSAHWCPPCRNFTPVLSQWYEENKTTKDLEIIFCSSDRDQEAFNEYYNKFMPSWTALPFNDKTTKDALSQAFEIRGIPSLIALGPTQPDGSRPIISKDGRTCVSNNQPFPQAWLPQPFADLSVAVDCKESDINETTSLLLLLDHVTDTSAQQHAVQTAKDFAQRHANNPDILVFFSTKNEGPAMRLRQLLKSARNDPVKAFLIKLDLPDDGAFYMSTEFLASDLSLDNIQSFFDNPGERYQIKG
mmetsp:Transcript_6390/g.9541  ORF Transcript_6390/g.9541 Transcript_6390/m.9541 type:complete len:351 (-) Transcript_6390:1126-2178(-)